MRSVIVLALIASSTAPLAAQTSGKTVSQAAAALPTTPVGSAVAEWLDAFNSADSIRLGEYYAKYGMRRSLAAQMRTRANTGGLDLVSIESSSPLLIEFVAKERNTGRLAFGVAELAPGDQPVMKHSTLQPIPPERTVADFRIDAATKAQVIESALAKLDANYVFPDVARKMAAAVRDRQKRGEYDNVTSGTLFAARLTSDLREVSKDGHLSVAFQPAGGLTERREPPRREPRGQMSASDCGFEKAERLDGNIGFLKFNYFAPPAECGDAATKMVSSLAGVRALVIDMRDNGGGHPAMVAHVSSYLFSKRTHLNDIWERPSNKTEQFFTNPDLPGAKIADSVPVYVLTSNRTFSGAEEFSYNLKNLKRATIIGETTGGGAHPVDGHRVSDKFMVMVPFARAINPITKTNWEGTGVEPDVKVPARDALTTALQMIRERASVP